jgi:SOS response regulatory protein OraA/RecX
MLDDWSDLSDDELDARLRQAGVSEADADLAVEGRDEPAWAECITEWLQ